MKFFLELYKLEGLEFPRSLWLEQETIGDPWLISFSDGSTLAFGGAVYIQWELKGGGFWNRLVLSKGKICPKSRIMIPCMELNGAVVNKRLTDFILQAITRKFGKVLHLVDSNAVLRYLHKEDQKLKPFEGV